MPSYMQILKKILSNKRKLEENETVCLIEECSATLQKKLPPKLKDPGSFTIPYIKKALGNLGANINLMSLSVFKKLGLTEVKDPLKAYLPKGESLDTGQDPNYGPS